MMRYIKVPIEVDKDGDCRYCPLRIKDIGESSPEFCPFTKDILYNRRLKACLEADITDLLIDADLSKDIINGQHETIKRYEKVLIENCLLKVEEKDNVN